jgi:hypothetical protein
VGQPPLEDSAALLHIIEGLRERRTPAGQADPLDDIGRQFFLNFLQDHIGGKRGDEPTATALAGPGGTDTASGQTVVAIAGLLPLTESRAPPPPHDIHRNYHHDSPHSRNRIDPQEGEQRSVRLVSSDHILDLVSNDDLAGHAVSAKLKKGVKRSRRSRSSCSEEDVRSSRNGSSQSPDVRLVSWASSGGSGRGSSPLRRRKLLSTGSRDFNCRSASSDSSSSGTSSSSSSSRSSSSSSSSSTSITSSSSESSSSDNTETENRTR